MKLSLTTTISMASIVAAGAAAYAINVNVLEAPAVANPPAATAAPATPVAAPVSGQASAQSAPTPITVKSTPVSAQTTKFEVGAAGLVLISSDANGLKVSSITPTAGWVSEKAEVKPDGSVVVRFHSGTERVAFTARKVDGKIETSVAQEMIQPPATAAPGTPAVAGAPVIAAAPGALPGATPGATPAIGAKPQIPASLGGDDDDDDDDDHGDDHDDDDDEDEDDD